MNGDQRATPIVKVEGLRISYLRGGNAVTAVKEASLAIRPGEAVGLVGESGSGKSTLARSLLGLNPQSRSQIDAGSIVIAGTDVTRYGPSQWEKIRGRPVAMIFQDPLTYLNPVMRIGRQIAESVRRHDRGADVRARVAELLRLVKLPEAIARAYPHELSGGMRQRVLIAIALGCRPKLLIADEPTTALDVTTQAEIMALLAELRERLGMAMLLISHDLGLVGSACSRIYVMYAGYVIENGSNGDVFIRPAHPYTKGLLLSAEVKRNADGRFVTIGGDVPNPATIVEGCPFRPRCPVAMDECGTMPAFTPIPNRAAHEVRCWYVERHPVIQAEEIHAAS
ncbi:MAG TPA: ABC transporter ATP-binding protein [Rhizobiaceae bacterium]|nr:ABC transporter ATP-binding protein [Rhizobiaceae bacterium]